MDFSEEKEDSVQGPQGPSNLDLPLFILPMSFPKALKSLYEEGPGGCRVDPGGEAKFIPSVPAQ